MGCPSLDSHVHEPFRARAARSGSNGAEQDGRSECGREMERGDGIGCGELGKPRYRHIFFLISHKNTNITLYRGWI